MGANRRKPRPPMEVGYFEEAAVARQAEDEYELPEVEYPLKNGTSRVRETALWALPHDALHADRMKMRIGACLDALRDVLGVLAVQRDEVAQLRESTRDVLSRLGTV
jgi:hypothetical protein